MKKIISLGITAVLLAGVFSGCGNAGKNDSMSVLKGETVRIAAWGDFSPQAGTELGDARLEKIAAAEEKYGCKVEFETVSDIFGQMELAASSGEVIADICTTRAHYIGPLARADALWSPEELTDTSNAIYNKDAFENSKVNGKSYGFWYDPYFVDQVLYFNKGILARAGIAEPYEMVRNKTWNYDAYLDIMRKTTDANSGIIGCGMAQAFESTFMKSNNASIYAKQSDGKWVQNTGDSKVLTALTFLADCVTKWKVIDPNNGRDWTWPLTQFAEGRYTTCLGALSIAKSNFKNMADDYGILPLPLGPDADEYTRPALELRAYCIQKSVPKERAAALMQFMNEAFEYPLDTETSIEGYYSSIVKDKESLEMLMMMQQQSIRTVEEFTAPDVRGTEIIGALQDASKGAAPVRSTLDSYSGKIQALLDEYYDQ